MTDPDRTSRLLDRLMPCPVAPPDLGTRVLHASTRAPAPPPRRWRWLAAVALASGAATFAMLAWRGREQAGSARALERQAVRVGDRAVAVLEPDGQISWRIQRGQTRIEQRSGDVFYRAEPGPLVVVSPGGEVAVTGTCFRVALHGLVSYVQVLEGSVVLRNAAGEAPLAAGEWGILVWGRAPGRLPASVPPSFALDQPVVTPRTARPVALAPPAFRDPVRPLAEKAFAFSAEERLSYARQCLFRWGLPRHLTRSDAPGPDTTGLTADERAAVARIFDDDRAQYFDQLRQLYLEVTGEDHVDESLSALALHHEIDSRGGRDEGMAVRKRMLQEWAGDIPPPRGPQSAVERFWRLQTGELDELTRKVSAVLGPERARALVRSTVDMAVTGTERDCPSGRR